MVTLLDSLVRRESQVQRGSPRMLTLQKACLPRRSASPHPAAHKSLPGLGLLLISTWWEQLGGPPFIPHP